MMNTTTCINPRFYGVKKLMGANCNAYLRALAFAIACFSSASFATQGLDYITPAKYQTMDKYNVNVTGNQVAPSIQTVAIGGALGLSHSITPMGNYFDLSTSLNGYHDKYAGGLKFTHLGTIKSPGYPDVPSGGGDATVMRASFLGQQADFVAIRNSDGAYLWFAYDGTDFHYETVGDKRHVLERRTDGLVWTQPDGTEVFFSTFNDTNTPTAHTKRTVEKIVYPNGFTIYAGSMPGVTTNTGFTLKYNFVRTDPGLELSKQSPIPPPPPGSNVPTDVISFIGVNPTSITAINTAIEPCNMLIDTPCTLPNKWPTATFTWPGGMPRAIFIGKSTFSVTNAVGGKTDLIYEAKDAGISDVSTIPSYTAGKLISPRLVEIKSAGATASSVFYTYKNPRPDFITNEYGILTTSTIHYDDKVLPGILTSATGILGTQAYDTSDLEQYHGKSYGSGGDIIVSQYTTSPVGILESMTDYRGDRVISFDLNYRNFVTKEASISQTAPDKVYHYDGRGNVDSVTQGTAVATALYPTTCTNRKTCNQPVWVKDPNGNVTDYEYDPQGRFGSPIKITLPANTHGIRAQTRYEYSPLSANYYPATGLTTGSLLYLKTAEKSCINSNYVGGACAGNDEVVTRFEYETKNLFMIGTTVMSPPPENKTLRTCYRYDIYGNQIGKTEPNANLTSCSN